MIDVRRVALAVALASALGACDRGAAEAPKPAASPPSRDALVASYDRGLDFLASKSKDGMTLVRGGQNVGVTGFCLLPVTERPGGVREKDKALVDQTLAYLAKSVGPGGGVDDWPTSTYDTAVSIVALVESKRPEYAAAIERAVKYVKSMQHADPTHQGFGGCGGAFEDPRADLSITCFAILSLEAAGVPKDDPFFQRALVYVERCQNRKANEKPGEPRQWSDPKAGRIVRADDGGGYAYPGWSKAGFDDGAGGVKVLRSCGSMTCSLLWCYQMLGVDAADGRVKSALDWLSSNWAADCNPGMQDVFPDRQRFDGLYYYRTVAANALTAMKLDKLRTPDGREIDWRADLAAATLAAQKPDGSWQSKDVQWGESVSVIATTYSLLTLAPSIR